MNLLGDVNVEDERNHDESQPALHPYQEEEVEGENHCELRPLHLHIEVLFLFIDHVFLFLFQESCFVIPDLELK